MADVVGYSRLMAADEVGTIAQLKANRKELFVPKQEEYHGRTVKLMGDGALLEFGSVVDATNFAIDVQRAIIRRNQDIPLNQQISYRIGINIGDIIVDGEDIHGSDVNITARLESICDPDGIFLTENAYHQAEDRVDVSFEALGKKNLKNIPEPVSVFRVLLDSAGVGNTAKDNKKASSGILRVVLVMAVIAAISVAALLYSRQPQSPADHATADKTSAPAAEPTAILPDKPSIAVLPFDNLSGDPEQEYFSDGITNDIITDLSKFSGLFVIASNSTFTYKGKPVKVQQVAEDLGVRYVLEGSVQRLGDQIRINAQLIDATSGGHLWAERYERDAEDLFAVQSEIIETIVGTLAFRVDIVEREQALNKDTESLVAYDYYLLGSKAQSTFTKETMIEARSLFETAIELDPNYARAYASLGFTHANLHAFGWTEDMDRSLEIALEMTQKAVALKPGDYYNHWALGGVYKQTGDFDRALAEDGVAQIKLAMRINPHYPDWYLWNLGWAQYFTGEYEEALASLKRMSNPNNGTRRTLAAVLVRLGRVEEARAVIAAFREQAPDFTVSTMEKFPFQNRTYLERWMEDLRTAGLPE